MERTNKRRENLSWPDQNQVNAQLEAIRELAKELRTDYPTDTSDESTNWSNKARNRRNALICTQFLDNGAFSLISGSEWLELFDLLGFSVDKETRKRFASHLNWYSFWYAGFKPRLSSKYAQRIHWYVHNFLFCLRNKLQTEKDYREGKYGSKGQAYFMEAEQQPTTPTGTPRISTQADEPINVSAEAKEGRKEAENGKTQIQIETANKFFKREWGKHAEMLGGLAECDGNVLCFYWRSLKNIVGKVRSRTYRFYPDHYEVESNIYNIYGCFNVQSIAYNYDGSIYTPPQPPTTPPTEPNEPTAHPTPERTETTKTANVSAKEGKTAEMPQILNCERQTVEHFKAIPNIAKLANAGIIINGVAWHTEYLDQSHNVLARVDNIGWHEDGKGFGGFRGSSVFGKTEIFESWDEAVIATIEALTTQSSKTPHMVKHITCTDKPRETVRKLPKLVIRNCRTTHVRQELGAQGYLMLADASAILAAINVPPIRGDCKIGIPPRAKPPNSTLYKKISILQPP